MIVDKGVNPGDVKKFRVVIDGEHDISAAVSNVTIFQDIMSPSTTAIINVMDTNNLSMNLPILPGQTVTVEVETDTGSQVGDGDWQWEFVIYKLGERDFSTVGYETYVLYAADAAYMKNQSVRVRRSYMNMPALDIAKSIFSEYLGEELEGHTAEGNTSVVIPGWTPFYAVNWLAKSATAMSIADFFLFQYPDGKYAFKSIDTLYYDNNESSGITFSIQPSGIRENDDIIDKSTHFNNYTFQNFDALQNLATGFYRSKLITVDLIDRSYGEVVHKIGDTNAEDKTNLSMDPKLLAAIEDANISFSPLHPGLFNTNPSYLDTATKWVCSRKSEIQRLRQERLLATFPGSAKARDWFAKNCEVDMPNQDVEGQEKFDKYRRGRYLITAMSHGIGKDTYIISAEMVKLRLEEAIE